MRVTPNSGTHLGPYHLHSLLGAGGMGQVFLAEDTRLDRKLALKLLSAEFTTDEARVRRFQQEARAASALNHPNIVTIYEVGQFDGAHYIATEFIDGWTLREQLARPRPALRQTLEIIIQIANALEVAHAAGIIHRDIKPENVMLRPDGYVKVLDFGLAKLTEKFIEPSAVDPEALLKARVNTDLGIVMGTAHYMSPEQARGLKVDARSDIFSLGVLSYELVAGRAPFDGPTTSDVLVSILEREPMPLARHSREVPAQMEWIIAKALAKDREERYQTIKDMLLDLRRLKQKLDFEAELQRSQSSGDQGGLALAVAGPPIHDMATEPITRTFEASAIRTTSSAEYLLSEIKRHKRGVLMTLVVLTLALAALAYSTARDKAIASVAVLPFITTTSDANTEYLSDAITDNIINSLSQLPNLSVLSRNAVQRYKGRETDLPTVGNELGVQAVLMGRVVQRGDDLQVSIALVDTRTNRNLWGQQYNRKFGELMLVQEEISRDISDNLRLRLSGEEKKRREAHELYIKGRHYWSKRTPDGMAEGIKYFEQATQLDPSYALAYAGLADCYNMLAIYSARPPSEAFPKAQAAAEKALEIDDTLAEAHASLAFSKFQWDWSWVEAEREFRRALQLKPTYAATHQWYSNYLAAMGRFDEAIAAAQRTRQLEPTSLITNSHLGWIYYLARQYDQSIAQAERAIKLDPNFFPGHRYLGLSYEGRQQYEAAIAEFQKAVTLSSNSALMKAELGHAYAAAGKRDEAQKMISELQEMAKQRPISPHYFALIYAGLGEKDLAFEWLNRSYEERAERLVWLKVDPRLDNLRSDPRFTELLRRIGLAP